MVDLAFPGLMIGLDDSQDHFQHKWFSDFTPHKVFFFWRPLVQTRVRLELIQRVSVVLCSLHIKNVLFLHFSITLAELCKHVLPYFSWCYSLLSLISNLDVLCFSIQALKSSEHLKRNLVQLPSFNRHSLIQQRFGTCFKKRQSKLRQGRGTKQPDEKWPDSPLLLCLGHISSFCLITF